MRKERRKTRFDRCKRVHEKSVTERCIYARPGNGILTQIWMPMIVQESVVDARESYLQRTFERNKIINNLNAFSRV